MLKEPVMCILCGHAIGPYFDVFVHWERHQAEHLAANQETLAKRFNLKAIPLPWRR
jgi:hypothetical protein